MPKILAVMMSFSVPEMSIQEDKRRFQGLKSRSIFHVSQSRKQGRLVGYIQIDLLYN